MAAPAWATNLTDIYVGGGGTFTALGGGAAGLNTETDYFIQGTDCKSKNAWTNAIKGLIHNNGSSFTVPTTGAVIAWLYYAAVNALEVQEPGGSPSNGGLMLVEGSGSGDYNRYNVAGSDTLTFNSWVPYPVDPNTATADDTVGSPSGTEQWVGVEANLPTSSGPTKGAPIAIDAVRYGRCDVEYTDGDVGNGYNTFAGAEGYGNDVTRRWGLIEPVPGASADYYMMGFHSFGVSGTAVDFRDANVSILMRDTPYVAAGFNRIEIINASSNVDWDNVIFKALGTQSLGTFVHTAGTFDAVSCQFIDVGAFTLIAASVMTGCIFRNTGIITAPGSDLSNSQVVGFEGTANTSPVVWDVNADPDTDMDGMSFEKGTAATHAIEFGSNIPSTITLRNMDFTGYNATQDQNDSCFHFRDTSGTITLNLVGCTSDFAFATSFRTDGATIIVVEDPVTTLVNVKDPAGANVQNARVILSAKDGSGDLPFEEAVTSITRSGSVATVTHTAHGIPDGKKTEIEGAEQQEYNGVKTITVTGANTYTFTVSGSPTTPATGTIISTGVMLEGLTDASGNISDSRTLTLDQPVLGVARKSTASPYFVDLQLDDVVDNANGLTINRRFASDE